MLIVPAENLWLGLPDVVGETFGWSPVYALKGLNYASTIMIVEQIYGGLSGTDCTIMYDSWVSLDGREFVQQGLPGASTNYVTGPAHPPFVSAGPIYGAFLRFRYRLDVSNASATAGVLFTLRVELSRKGP